jgi:hypothetical protein
MHVADEAATVFLSIYNPTATALREKLGYWPMPNFTFESSLTGLVVGIFLRAFRRSQAPRQRPISEQTRL